MYYSNKTSIDGVRCTVSPEGGLGSGKFRALFERELASLEQIEAIHWDMPQITGDSAGLPEGCGYQVDDITYAHATCTYHVTFHVLIQYLGDVSGYQTFGDIAERLDVIVSEVRDKDVSLERSLDLFDEAIALGSKAVSLVDTTDFSPEEEARLAGEGAAAGEKDAEQSVPSAPETPVPDGN